MNRLAYLLFIGLLACAQPKENEAQPVTTIDFDIEKESGLGPDDMECIFIPLETKEDGLLSLSFDDVQFVDGKIFIINTLNNLGKVFVFSKKGRFITQIGGIGQGPGEYQQPYKLHINKKKNMITVADRRLNRLTNYDLNSFQYLSNVPIPFNFGNCVWLTDELILWSSEGGIDTGKRQWYCACITDEKMTIVSTFHETKPFGYTMGNTSLYKCKENVFVGLPFSTYIYQMDVENTSPVWELSFGKQKLPPRSLVVDERENNIVWLNKVLRSDYILAFRAYDTSDCLGVSFYGKSLKRHVGFYDKRTRQAYAYTAEKFMDIFHLYGIYEIINTYNDYFIARAEPRMLKKYIPKRDDLRRIAEGMTEEDNPVLCLFKFK